MDVRMVHHEAHSFHGVFGQTDLEASEPATVDLLAMFAAFLRPRIVVEAGTYKAHCCCAVANTFRQLGHDGHIYTADVIDQGLPKALADGELVPLAPWITFHHGDYLDMLATVPGPVDLAYIDASNREDPHQRMRHADATYERMSPGGLMFVDDTESVDWAGAKSFQKWANIHLHQHRGLSIIQRPI